MAGSGIQVILVTSAKGGAGKSTVAMNLAFAVTAYRRQFAVKQPSVLLVDFDLTNRALDLMLGCENSVVFDTGDLIKGNAAADDVIRDAQGICFAAAPSPDDRITDPKESLTAQLINAPGKVRGAVAALADAVMKRSGAEQLTVIIDSSGTDVPRILSPITDVALIPAGQSPASVRAAERTGMLTDACGAKKSALIINNFDIDAAKRQVRPRILELIDGCRLPLYGVVPHDEILSLAQDAGMQSSADIYGDIGKIARRSQAAQAFFNIAMRLDGRRVPIFYGMKGFRQRDKIE